MLASAQPIVVPSDLLPRVEWPNTGCLPPRALFICGYRRTGKDTLATDISEDRITHRWRGYVRADGKFRNIYSDFLRADVAAFHDPLWKFVRNLLGLPRDFDYEGRKDEPRPDDFGRTIRDYMIAVGSAGRTIDRAYWVKQAFARFCVPEFLDRDATVVVCPDHRFRAEYEAAVSLGLEIVTLRVYRSAVPVPPPDVESEHDLDDFQTDYLLVESEEEFVSATKVWPMYEGYVYNWVMQY